MTHLLSSHRTALLVAAILLLIAAMLMFAGQGATEPIAMPVACPPNC